MQGTGGMLEGTGTSGVARAIAGIALLILIAGIWACLWVPPWPIF